MGKASSATLTLERIIEHQRTAVRMQNFDVLGKLDTAKVQRDGSVVTMDFGKQGPSIARHRETGELLLVSEWLGLPELRGTSETICTACAVPCDECKNGKRTCTYPGCGGAGEISISNKQCPANGCAEKSGKFNPDCKTCNGRGAVPDPIPCPSCKGSKVQECYLCRGSGRRASGRVKGNICTGCDGHGRQAAKRSQPIKDFTHKTQPTLDGMTVLGPIVGLLWHTTSREETARFVSCRVNPDATNNLMVMLLERPAPGAQAFLLGGNPVYDG